MEYASKVRLKEFDASVGLERGAGKFKEITWYLVKMIFFMTAFPFPNKLKVMLLRFFGAKVGDGVVIKPRVNIHFPWKLVIGDHSWIGEEVFILNFELISIGNNCCISQRSFLCGGNHDYRAPSFPYRNGPIILRDGVWIGACSFVAPNVVIEVDVVITAGSYVSGSLKEVGGIYRGNPAVKVGQRWK